MDILTLVILLIAVLTAFTAYSLGNNYRLTVGSQAGQAKKRLTDKLNRSNMFVRHLDKTRIKLAQKGANYIFHREIEPITYYGIEILTTLYGMFTAAALMDSGSGANTKLFIIILGGAVGFKAPDVLLNVSNKSDRLAMMIDIKTVYTNIKLQVTAGVFITDALTNMYKFVKNKRLKAALMELSMELAGNNDVEESLDNFALKFDDSFIRTFTTTIKQSMKTGRSSKMLEDITKQIESVQESQIIIERQKNDMKQLFEMIAWFTAIMAILLFCLGTDMGQSISSMMG